MHSERAASEGKGPGRKVYRPTPAGYTALQEAVYHALAHPVNRYSGFLLGLANLPGLPLEQAQKALGEYATEQRETLVQMQMRESFLPEDAPLHVRGMFELSNRLLEAELNWVEEFMIQLKERNFDDNEN